MCVQISDTEYRKNILIESVLSYILAFLCDMWANYQTKYPLIGHFVVIFKQQQRYNIKRDIAS